MILVIILLSQNFVGKMKNEMWDIAIEEFVVLEPKINSIPVSDSSKYRKAESLNKNFVTKISHNECNNILLSKMFKTFNE